MTIDEIANFCEFKDCQVSVGGPEKGFLHVNGRGISRDAYTWGRFNMLGEVKTSAAPEQLLEEASVFMIRRGANTRQLNRTEFATELEKFLKLVAD